MPTSILSVSFAPGQACQQLASLYICAAKTSIRMLAYSLTDTLILAQLINAHKRGIDVRICCDAKASKEHGELAHQAAAAGICTCLDSCHPIMHDKTLVIDGTIVLLGSYNWSFGAQRNAENLLAIADPDLASAYQANWALHAAHSVVITS